MTQIIPMEETPDIYQAFLDGNPDSFELICLFGRVPLIIYGLKFLDDQHAVEDAVTETFMVFRDYIGPFNNKDHLQAWLHKTVRNKCLAALRKQQQLVPLDDEAEYTSDLTASQYVDIKDSEAIMREIIRLIMQGIDKLPPKRRHDCYAHFIQGKTIAQIAENRGVSRATVDESVKRGLKAIRKYLIDMGLKF